MVLDKSAIVKAGKIAAERNQGLQAMYAPDLQDRFDKARRLVLCRYYSGHDSVSLVMDNYKRLQGHNNKTMTGSEFI